MPDRRPNVLLICTDHWPASLLGCAGHPVVRTPTLDQLAANGVHFPNAYSECPVCVPARRTLMTGLSPHSHGMLTNSSLPMPEVPTLAQTFRDAGYQACAVGKLHVQPQRQRIGFDEVILDEEGRGSEGARADDYELFLGDHGHAGERFAGGMCNNEYLWRPWHLEERFHVTNWAAQQMSRQIVRRDPLRPAFWYLSFSHPHPPLHPLSAYLDMYRDLVPPDPFCGDWAGLPDDRLAPAIQREIQSMRNTGRVFPKEEIRAIRRAFYALCTHIDHQLRVVLGTLRQEGLLGETIIGFTADHGDMLGNHHLWAKHWMYEDSARVPMILVGTEDHRRSGAVPHHTVDSRLVALRDLMPTLLELAGITPPSHCEGLHMLGNSRREFHFGAYGAPLGPGQGNPTRMVRDASHKLVYYPHGNHRQLFDMRSDRQEMRDLVPGLLEPEAGRGPDPAEADALERLTRALRRELPREESEAWGREGELCGGPARAPGTPRPNIQFSGQRGTQWPNP